ncbi:MAG: phenylacetate--CoA ligase family protein, partial [Pseudomonadota bacterium]
REKGLSPQDIPLRLGCFGGEGGVAVPATRRKIEAGLGIEAFDYYGLAEIGPTIASECEEKAGIHWVEDHILVEVVNPESKKPCAEGEPGVLVITHLTKEATPMLRYWTNDLARLTTEKCACGRAHARSEGGILGRADDMVIYKGAKFYPVQVEKVVRSLPELSDEFRILLTTDERMGTDVCTVVVETINEDLDKTALTGKLKSMFKEELLVTPLIRIQPFESLERTTFKAKRIIDQRKK